MGACWFGYDNARNSATALATYAKRLWQKAMNALHQGLEAKEFEQPATTVKANFCQSSGMLATTGCSKPQQVGYYKPDNVPGYCNQHSGKPNAGIATTGNSAGAATTTSPSPPPHDFTTSVKTLPPETTTRAVDSSTTQPGVSTPPFGGPGASSGSGREPRRRVTDFKRPLRKTKEERCLMHRSSFSAAYSDMLDVAAPNSSLVVLISYVSLSRSSSLFLRYSDEI